MFGNYYINKELPYEIRKQLVAPISRSYQVVENIRTQFPLLNGPMMINSLSNLRQTLVEHELMRMIDNGLISGLKCRVSNNKKRTHPFLEIFNESLIATISQVKHPVYLPKEAIYRNDRAASNQLSFFEEDNKKPDKLYFIVTHGYSGTQPSFVGIGLPNENNTSWIEYLNVMTEPYIVPSSADREKSLVELTEFAKEVLKNESNNEK